MHPRQTNKQTNSKLNIRHNYHQKNQKLRVSNTVITVPHLHCTSSDDTCCFKSLSEFSNSTILKSLSPIAAEKRRAFSDRNCSLSSSNSALCRLYSSLNYTSPANVVSRQLPSIYILYCTCCFIISFRDYDLYHTMKHTQVEHK